MIDLNRIRSLRTLEEMKKDLNEFLVNPDVRKVYLIDLEWSEDDYDADKEAVIELLEAIAKRERSLTNYLKVQPEKKDLPPQKLETEACLPES